MGGVYTLIEASGGMTRSAIIEACKAHDLVRGSIDRMILYAKKNHLLIQEQATLFVLPKEDGQEQREPLENSYRDDESSGVENVYHQPAPSSLPTNGTVMTEMSPGALVFLEDPLARQLAVAWVTCKGNEASWVANSGIRPWLHGTARQLCVALRTSGICRDGGVTDALALKYISTIVATPLLKRMKDTK